MDLNHAFVHQTLAIVSLKQGKLIEAETAIVKVINTLKHFGEMHEELSKLSML